MSPISQFLVLAAVAVARSYTPHPGPKFSDFPASPIFHGTPAVPKLSKDQKHFRTRIRTGTKSKVEFSGHYTIPIFGCGAGCSMFYIVDSVTGKVYDGFSVVGLPGEYEEGLQNIPARIEFHPDSRLLKVAGCPNEENCGYYDYLMVEGKGLKLLHEQLLPPKYQDHP